MLLKENNMIKLHNVEPIRQFGEIQHFATKVNIKELKNIYNRLIYDGEAQRGRVQGKPVIDKKHVEKIVDSFLSGDSIRGHLTWNMRQNNPQKMFVYDESQKTMVIESSQLITLPDSAHRHEALKKISEEIGDEDVLESEFPLDIYNLNFDEEKEFFSTINGKGKKPTNNRVLYLSNKLTSKLVENVMNDSNLKNRVECVKNTITDGKLVKFSTLHDSIFGKSTGSFSPYEINKDNYNEYLKWFVKFYNKLLESREEFKIKTKQEKQEVKGRSLLLEEIVWWGYAQLSKDLMNKKNWHKTLVSKLNKKTSVEGGSPAHFLDKSLPIWHASIIRSKYNHITGKIEPGTSVTNSNTTRHALKKIFAIELGV